MEFQIDNINVEHLDTSYLVIGIFEKNNLPPFTKKIDKISNNYITNLLINGDLEGKIGQTLILYNVPNIGVRRTLLVGCGQQSNLDEFQYKIIINKVMHILKLSKVAEVIFCLSEIAVKERDLYWKIRQTIELIHAECYSFDQFKSNKNLIFLKKIILNISTNEINHCKKAMKHALAIAEGVRLAKDLSNMPPNICNAKYLVSRSYELSKQYIKNITTKIIDHQQMKELGMNAYLAVAQGSQNEPFMSVIEYKGDNLVNNYPIVLIGKGLTFDCGGISIKSASAMEEMKYDMCGAAAVYGILQVVAKLNLPLHIIGILAGCENMINGSAMRPGDILTSMSGKTIEVLNTDAEGRLVLCDVLTYVERFNPELVIDIATLTGACVVALGHCFHGLMSNQDALVKELMNASIQSGDLSWHLPLLKEYKKQLRSPFADITNTGGRAGGAITAAYFLSMFANKYKWAHLDIAGTAWYSNNSKEATGRPVPMIAQFLINRCSKI